MFKHHARFYHSNKLDTIDAALLEAIAAKVSNLQELAEYIGQPGKIATLCARLKRQEKRGWILSCPNPKSLRDKDRRLTETGRRMLALCRRNVL